MKYMAYVVGNDPEAILKKHMNQEYEFVVAEDITEVCKQAGIEYDPSDILGSIRRTVGVDGKVALIDVDQMNVMCPKLYAAGFRHFITVDGEGNFLTVKRIALKPEAIGHDDVDEFFRSIQEDRGDPAIRFDQQDFYSMLHTELGDTTQVGRYQIGGEWGTHLIPKKDAKNPNTYQLPIKDIDWNAMLMRAKKRVRKSCGYDALKELNDRYDFKTLREIKDDLGVNPKDATSEQLEQAHKEFENQVGYDELVEKTGNGGPLPVLIRFTDWLTHPEEWWTSEALPHYIPALFITEDQYLERCRPGFMEILEDNYTPEDWVKTINKIIKEQDPETLLTVVEIER